MTSDHVVLLAEQNTPQDISEDHHQNCYQATSGDNWPSLERILKKEK